MGTKTAAAPKEAAPATKSPTMKLMKGGKAATTPAATKTPAKPAAPKAAEPVEQVKAATTAKTEALTEASEDLIVKTAHEIENLTEAKAFKLVPSLIDNIDQTYFRLGGVLSVIQGGGWYMEKGFDNFRSFVESECGMAYRKSMYLIQIYNGLVESGIAWDKVGHLGWTKLKDLAGILTKENVDEWVGIAENMTVLQLQEHIKASTAGVTKGSNADKAKETESKKTTTITFKVHEDQKQTIREALDKAKHEAGTDVDTVALENICLSFLGGESKLAKVPTLKELMTGKSVEEVLGAFGEVFPKVEIEATVPEE